MLKIIHMMSLWKEIICFEYALFFEYAIFVKSLVVLCVCCHGDMNWDNSFCNFDFAVDTQKLVT